jgi:hypothetical protein
MDAVQISRAWLEKEARSNRLAGRWSALERHLIQHHRWFELSEAEQLALPEAAEMWEIDGQLERLHAEQNVIGPILPTLAATSRTGILLKFRVLAQMLRREDYRDEAALLRSALLDLKVVRR